MNVTAANKLNINPITIERKQSFVATVSRILSASFKAEVASVPGINSTYKHNILQKKRNLQILRISS